MIPEARIWDKKNKKMWKAGFYLFMTPSVELYADTEDGPLHMDKEQFDVMFWTGLKTKSGTKIFDGDVLGGDPHGTVLVRWDYDNACFESVSYFIPDEDEPAGRLVPEFGENTALLSNELKDCWDAWEVLGNISENPELMDKIKDEAA